MYQSNIKTTKILIFISLLAFFKQSISQEGYIRRHNLIKHIFVLSSDSLQGRGIKTSGIYKAQFYIENQFKEIGLIPAFGKSFAQEFQLIRKKKNSALIKHNQKLLFNPWHFYFSSAFNRNDSIIGEVLFEYNIDTSAIKHKTKERFFVALLANDTHDGIKRAKKINKETGAKTFLIALDDYSIIDSVLNYEYVLNEFTLNSNYQHAQKRLNELDLIEQTNDSITLLFCYRDVLGSIFNLTDQELKMQLKNSGGQNLQKPTISCYFDIKKEDEILRVANCVGFIKGADTTKNIVLSAHYDHLGVELGTVYPGADDNASGVAVLLETSRVLRSKYTNGFKPRYNICFIAFSAEEQGLYGSEWFINHPVDSLARILLNINLDMIGRWDEAHTFQRDYVYLLCKGDNRKEIFNLGKDIAKTIPGFSLTKNQSSKEKNTFLYRSDHYHFYAHNIPVAFFNTGLHKDYHTPFDTPNKINYDNLANIAKIVTIMADSLANGYLLNKN